MPPRARVSAPLYRPSCPSCFSGRVVVRWTAEDVANMEILRHRECERCGQRWVTGQTPERVRALERRSGAA